MFRVFIFITSMIGFVVFADDGAVVKDPTTALSFSEVKYGVVGWPRGLREKALSDESLRNDFLMQMLMAKKIEAKMLEIKEKDNEELYWKGEYAIRTVLNKIYVADYLENLKIPEMLTLAQERYKADTKRFGFVGEKRKASHILLMCRLKSGCDAKERKEEAELILKKLKAGESFKSLVKKYSEDFSNKWTGGELSRAVTEKEAGYDGNFIKALFMIKNIDEYSEIVHSRFGFHIIKLDAKERSSIKTFDEVKDQMLKILEDEYKLNSLKAMNKSYVSVPDVKIEGEIVNNILKENGQQKN